MTWRILSQLLCSSQQLKRRAANFAFVSDGVSTETMTNVIGRWFRLLRACSALRLIGDALRFPTLCNGARGVPPPNPDKADGLGDPHSEGSATPAGTTHLCYCSS